MDAIRSLDRRLSLARHTADDPGHAESTAPTNAGTVGGDPGVLSWGTRWLAVMERTTGMEGTIFIDPETGARSVLKGWHPLAWSPGGDQLLVNDAMKGGTLGIVEASDLSSVKEVGRVSGPVYDIDWLPA